MHMLRATLIAVVTAAAPAYADITLHSWETGTEGWTADTDGVPQTLTTSLDHNTHGLSSLVGDPSNQGAGGWLRMYSSADLVANEGLLASMRLGTTLSVDVTPTEEQGPDGGWQDNYVTIELYTNVGNITTNWDAFYEFPSTDTATITLDYSALDLDAATTIKIQFVAYGNEYNPGVLYFDNLRTNAVPEPAGLALMAMGGIALLRRRRA